MTIFSSLPYLNNSQESCDEVNNSEFGCCSNNNTFPAHGLNDFGCCANSEFGCCPDDVNIATGPYGKKAISSSISTCLFFLNLN